MLFILMFFTPALLIAGIMVYWFITSIKAKEFMDAAFSLSIVLAIVGFVGMMLTW